MKKLLALLLALIMVLSLAACGEPADGDKGDNKDNGKENAHNTDPSGTTQRPSPADQWVDLVTSYQSVQLGVLERHIGEYTLNFEYNNTYTGGTAEMITDGQAHTGTFTCDKNYNINHIEIALEEADLVMDMTFDDQHRLLSAVIQGKNETESELLYKLERSYDSKGKMTRDYFEIPMDEMISQVEYAYNEAGFLVENITSIIFSGVENYLVQRFVYMDGYMTAIEQYDKNGVMIISIPFEYEDQGDKIRYSGSDPLNEMVIIHDKQGNLLGQEVYVAGEFNFRVEYTYDGRGNRLSENTFIAATDTNNHVEYTYTEDGRLTETRNFVKGVEAGFQKTTFIQVLIPID